MKGYWIILGTSVTDQEAQKTYGALWAPIAQKYQAKLKTVDASSVLREARDAQRVLVVEFPSHEAAVACYEDPAYQEAKQFALQASKRELLIVAGELA
ncbi:hypothetical protein BSFA1_67780 (plasmid) [Burkholderia sp. SFA1]|uniref:DUF1330 domain-containing protein n=1 Tax=unclassified Caballeronia TaxID=2646786 RepID=UPI001F4331D4|nr:MULTISPECIES: DUF1330 domain-containing protein [unclassified Caballeronia]MCE4546553.1 DUF1330 domain-containing protein [Caballeronia sp. PC1]MCE4572974.1 DUF1330 domain-containing protein [Caballeronia sp. CLC5]BBQ01650.1 hypothetical protein BSFA1_67780 [Burkholderia sp. SFA1]